MNRNAKENRPCLYNYHDDSHPDLCEFESMLDIYLCPDDELSEGAIQLRDNLIQAVYRMYKKVLQFEKEHRITRD